MSDVVDLACKALRQGIGLSVPVPFMDLETINWRPVVEVVIATIAANGLVIVPRAVLVPRLSAETRQLVSDHAEAASSFSNKSDRKLATGLRLLLEQEERMSAALNGAFPEGERP